MNFLRLAAVAALCLIASANIETRITPQTDLMSVAKAEVDATLALAKGDVRFVGVREYSIVKPGLPDEEQARLKDGDVRVLDGTSCTSDFEFMRQAMVYAAGYNRVIRAHRTI